MVKFLREFFQRRHLELFAHLQQINGFFVAFDQVVNVLGKVIETHLLAQDLLISCFLIIISLPTDGRIRRLSVCILVISFLLFVLCHLFLLIGLLPLLGSYLLRIYDGQYLGNDINSVSFLHLLVTISLQMQEGEALEFPHGDRLHLLQRV
mmetsp:Transcript_35867/g.34923  ORF Transcript_35867/g.34923 Transcript_35867/m.34923 type:complete len:151 (-) Transcript_35867:119-571(-)